MHILILDPFPFFDFTASGHRETHVTLTSFETPLESILATLPTPPDCIIQMETLDTRHFVSNLDTAPCPTVFFSFDTHLNMFWHRHYARLFDAVATPHVSLFAALPEKEAIRRVFRLSHAGTKRPWKPHASRGTPFGFCGRRTAERPLRTWMLELLERELPLTIRDGLPFDAMLDFYGNTRAVPNEAICFEVNCRLFEAASAGAVPLTPDCGPDQEAVFTPGTEILVYTDGLDLVDKARWIAGHPEQAEKMGRAAWERVQREHLPAHRASTFLKTLPTISQARATGGEAALRLWLTYGERMKTGHMGFPLSYLLSQSETLPQTPEMLTGLLHLLALPSRQEDALTLCRMLLAEGIAPSSGACNATASAAALLHGDFPLAQAFRTRFCDHAPASAMPYDTPFSLCLAWAANERREGRAVRPGFAFSSAKALLPACAFEFVTFAEEMAANGISGNETASMNIAARAADEKLALLQNYPAYLPYRLGLTQNRTGIAGNWQALLEAASLSLRCCLVEQGARLLARAGRTAAANHEEPAFLAALAASPARAYSLRDHSSGSCLRA